MARLIVLDSREWIEIKNSAGEVTGGFLFNPTDMDIIKRAEQIAKFFENVDVPEDAEGLMKLNDDIRKQFDILLGESASGALFEHTSPMALREDGSWYCEYVLDVIIPFIEGEFNTRIKRANDRVAKYTRKYTKKKA